MASDKSKPGTTGMGLSSVNDMQGSLDTNNNSNDNHPRADNMAALTPPPESLHPELEENYQPLLPDNSADARTSMIFLNGDKAGKRMLAGRAMHPDDPANTASSSANAVAATSHQNTTQAVASSADHDSPPTNARSAFRRNRVVSLISRRLTMDSDSEADQSSDSDEASSIGASPDFVVGGFVAANPFLFRDDFFEYTFALRNADSLPPDAQQEEEMWGTVTSNYIGTRTNGHENAMAAMMVGISVGPLDAENSILTIDGIAYQMPNSDSWLYPYHNDDVKLVIPAAQLVRLIRRDFGMSIWQHGAQLAVEMQGGHILEEFLRQTPTSRAMTTRPSHLGASPLRDFLDRPIIGAASMRINDRIANLGLGSREMSGRHDPRPLQSSLQLIRSSNSMVRAGSQARSTDSANTGPTSDSDSEGESEFEMGIEEITEFGNIVRTGLQSHLVTVADCKEVLDLVNTFLANESTEYAVELSAIIRIRFDKVLGEILREEVDPSPPLMERSRRLQQAWIKRFGPHYLQIDDLRLKSFITHGLGGLVLKVDHKTRVAMWEFHRAATPVADAELEAGQWFFNMPSLYKDGLVKQSKHMLTTGKYDSDTLVLPLLAGVEVAGPDPDTYQYSRSDAEASWGPLAHDALGKKVQVLRGYGLKSKLAPKAGIRYDGEYEIIWLREFHHDETPEGPKLLRIVFRRLPRQISMDALSGTPDPGQVDNWSLYMRYIRQMTTGLSSVEAEHDSSEYDLNDAAYMELSFDDVFSSSY